MPTYDLPQAKGLPPGGKVMVTLDGREYGIYNVGGRLRALRNVCPDQSGPLCQGDVFDRIEAEVTPSREIREYVKEKQAVVACPWHGWEYDLRTGECLWNPRYRVKVYDVEVAADGTVRLTI
ncbi:MAG TPA: Rieske 2Fe-2S domain-containing protein [Terriglobia bacterium]|nr:Rieske 2Fe-2S domain-containing protein [Terriglobia bacterium]